VKSPQNQFTCYCLHW